jgi:amino acid transporter/mannitol/fructose-specific phosphotransferase system IIA component (Ntr-type)
MTASQAGQPEPARLGRRLGLLEVFCIASGAMISSGLFVLPGLAHARAGPGVVFSYLLAGLLALTGVLSIGELTTAMPRAGGDYFFITRGLGAGAGTVAGLLSWFSLATKSAFALVGMAAFSTLIVELDVRAVALLLCIAFVGLNVIGIKEAARAQVVLVGVLLVLLGVYVAAGVSEVRAASFEPFAPGGIAAVLSTAGFVFVSYGGLLKVASIAEEVKRPGRNIPLAMALSLVVVVITYTLVVFVTTGVLPGTQLDGSLTPISDGAAVFLGASGRLALGIAAVLAFVSTANAGIMAAARYPYGLSRDGLVPKVFGKVSGRFRTPYVSILMTGAFMAGMLLLRLEVLVKAASTVLILTYVMSNVSVIVLRESRLQNYQPSFRSPLYPWVQVIGVLGFSLLLLEMGEEALIITVLLIGSGVCAYGFYGRIRANRESALLHLVERITARELTTGLLESELREIIRERDEIIRDRFDELVEDAVVLDLEGCTSAGALFRDAAHELAPRLDVGHERLLTLLLGREAESSTAISPHVAIPHVIIEGANRFSLLLARCRAGLAFSERSPSVHAVFILAGTKDQRNFHLRSLAAIAQIVREPDFDKRWLAARGSDGLRDILLLGKRRRD